MLSRRHGFVFVHGRKAGGRSIKAALAPLCEDERYLHSGVLSGTVDPRPEVGVWDRERHRGMAIIANVRNPFDRMVSAYRYYGLGGRLHGRTMSFDEFVEARPGRDRFGVWLHVSASYSTLLVDEDGPMWTHLVRLESIAEDFAGVVEDLGLPIPSGLAHVNPASNKVSDRATLLRYRTGRRSLRGALDALGGDVGYRRFYSKASRRAVESGFADDLERFGYDF